MTERETQDPIGYGRPPRHTRFKPGQSGNPRGRPRRKQNLAELVAAVLDEKVTVSVNGAKKRIRVDVAMLLRVREKALKGDLKAINILLDLRQSYMPDMDSQEVGAGWSDEDLAIIANTRSLLPGDSSNGTA